LVYRLAENGPGRQSYKASGLAGASKAEKRRRGFGPSLGWPAAAGQLREKCESGPLADCRCDGDGGGGQSAVDDDEVDVEVVLLSSFAALWWCGA
jgi:hypothetical protein